jgi:Domain of unknown function (DUF4124)
MPATARTLLTGALLGAAGLLPLHAQVVAPGPGIFTCVDAQGRKITSDRPILECIDREQKQLNPSGTVQRAITPPPTARERVEQETREREAATTRARIEEEKRRDRALLTRYPNQARHDGERAEAVRQIDEVILTAQRRITDLQDQRKKLETELEFYRANPAKAPAPLKRQLEENQRNVDSQVRFIGDKQAEKSRIHERFDVELKRLEHLWAVAAGRTPPASTPASTVVPRR